MKQSKNTQAKHTTRPHCPRLERSTPRPNNKLDASDIIGLSVGDEDGRLAAHYFVLEADAETFEQIRRAVIGLTNAVACRLRLQAR